MPRPEYFVYPITDRPYHQKFFYSRYSKEDAKRKAEEWQAAHIQNPVYFKDLALQWLEEVKQDKQAANYTATYETPTTNHIIPYFGERVIGDIKAADIKTFYRRKSDLSQSTLSKIKICLAGIFSLAVERGLVAYNVAADIMPESKQIPNEKRVLSQKQLNEYYNAIEAECPQAAIIILAGHRIGEICGIRTDDANNVDPDIVPIYRSIMPDGTVKPPKSKHARFIPCKQCADLIRRVSMGVPHGYLFGDRETPPRPATIAAQITRALERIGLPDLTPHELRHTFATVCKRNGMGIYDIQKLLGHSDAKTTANYIKDEIATLRDAMKSAGLYERK